jgi:RHS repeat-associated protein
MKIKLSILAIFLSIVAQSQSYFTDTKGELAIANAGQATYTIPIALPPSILNYGPSINLVYSSGVNGGIAGQGWSISTISNISRIASRRDIDGFIDGVDFDDNDKLSLDGQRLLLKTGIYWQDGSTYMTEYKSNSKIELKIEGSAYGPQTYFIVTNPDGSRIWYGSTGNGVIQNATSANAWYIVRSEDAHGNFITYNYTNVTYNNTSQQYIANIMFSGNEAQGIPQVNKIVFNYFNARRVEKDFIKGNPSFSSKTLDNIQVFTNNNLFRKYQFTRTDEDGLGYERVTKVQEFNGEGEPSNPIFFKYNDISPTTTTRKVKSYYNLMNPGIQNFGDYDGDGRLDFTDVYHVFTKLYDDDGVPTVLNMPEPYYATIPATTLKDNKINQFQSIVKVETDMDFVRFRVHNLEGNAFTLNYMKKIDINNTAYCGSDCLEEGLCPEPTYKRSSTGFQEGDFNGDGISEVLIVTHQEYKTYLPVPLEEGRQPEPEERCEYTHFISDIPSEVRLVDLNPNVSTTFGTPGNVALQNISLLQNIKQAQDFNGDGKTDLLSLLDNGTYKIISFKQLTESPWVQLEVIGQGVIDEYSKTKQMLSGDFNGDGKVDFILPDTEGGENNILWHIYYSNPDPAGGSFFKKSSYDIVEYWPNTGTHFSMQTQFSSYHAIDINKDGKTDLVRVWKNHFKPEWTINDHDVEWQVTAFTNCIGNSVTLPWIQTYDSNANNPMYLPFYSSNPELPTAFAGNFRYKGANTDLVIVRGNSYKVEYYHFNKDVEKDNRLVSVTEANGKIKHTIEYKPMQAEDESFGNVEADFYSSSNSVNYPDIEVIRNPKNFLVSKLTATVNGQSKFQKFRYRGSVSNFNYGSIGFLRTARSGWYLSDSDPKIWTVQNFDVSLRGANNITWTSREEASVFHAVPNNLISTKINDFLTYTDPTTHQYNVLLNKQTDINAVTNVTIEKEYSYDGGVADIGSYGLQTTEAVRYFNETVLQGKYVTTIDEYDNNPGGVGSEYHIGRPKSKSTSKFIFDASGTVTDTRTSSEILSYEGVNLSQIEKKGNGTDALIEAMSYDGVGNLTSKSVSMPSSSPAVAPRTIYDDYDPTRRFVKTKTDHQNFVTEMQYNDLGQVTKSTDYMGVVSDFTYDGWGKMLTSTVSNISDIPLVTEFEYEKFSTGEYTVKNHKLGTNEESTMRYDVLGRVIKSTTKGLSQGAAASNISISKEYDSLGRLLRESEPYHSSPTRWEKTYSYDELSRPIKIVNASTRTQNISYLGLTSTIIDNGRTTTATLDAMGNKVQTTDDGGTIEFSYYANGLLRKTNYSGHEVIIGIDGWGNKASVEDPNAGLYTYKYDGFGQMVEEVSPKGQIKYLYDDHGKLITKIVDGDGADFKTTFSYNGLAQIKNEITETAAGLPIDAYEYEYDGFNRLIVSKENSAKIEHTNTIAFDEYGRTQTEINTIKEKVSGDDVTSSFLSKYFYTDYSGMLYKVTDEDNQLLWQLNSMNAKMQTLRAILGNGIIIENEYSADNYFTSQKHSKNDVNVLYNTYDFDGIKGLLNYRNNHLLGILHEDFVYDNMDRLKTWDNPLTGNTDFNNYDERGRITLNNNVGDVNYNPDVQTGMYRKANIKLNQKGLPYYGALGGSQVVNYTMFKSPISINESNKGKMNFEYNSHLSRAMMNYDYGIIGTNTEKEQRKTKLYTNDGASEVIIDKAANTIKILTYIGGDAYSAFAYHQKLVNRNTGVTTETKYYLHRDYLGSILAITDEAGVAMEKRHFDAWGNLSKIVGQDNVLLSPANGLQFLDRGYTSHEHLHEVRLIHMNGRLYDPILRGFLMPDNFIQHPENTQSYNRYAYVMNNPLAYNDPSGEEAITLGIAVIIAVAVAITSYTITALLTDVPFTAGGLLRSAVIAAASACITYGIGSASTSLFTNFYSRAAFEAVSHGIVQGGMAEFQGGNFWSGFAAGALSSIAASAWSGGDTISDNGDCTMSLTKHNGLGAGLGMDNNLGMVAFGTVVGGGGALLAGGNFWQGAAIGLMVSGLNHAMHKIDGEAVIEQTKSTNETTATDGQPYVLNESKRTIYYKPEETAEALPLGPGQKTYDPVDGINVRGKVYKVPDGYSNVTVKANFQVHIRYNNLFYYGVGLYKGGLVTRSDFDKGDTGWDNLFKIKN